MARQANIEFVTIIKEWKNHIKFVLARSLSMLACQGSNFAIQFLSCPRSYVVYASYIQRIINYKADTEFGYDGKHGAY
jgi:hypothetical protein